jgi:hypothetical protein
MLDVMAVVGELGRELLEILKRVQRLRLGFKGG